MFYVRFDIDDDDDDDDDDVEAPTLTGYTLHLLLWSSKSVESIQ